MSHLNAETRGDSNDRSPISKIARYCFVIGIFCLFIFQLFVADENSQVAMLFSDSQSQQNELQKISLPEVARLIYATGFSLIMLSSLYFMIRTWHTVGIGYKLALGLMQVWMAMHVILAFSSGPKPSLPEICGTKGPLTWISCGIVFVGISTSGWELAKKVFVFLVNIAAFVIVVKVTFSGSITSTEQQAGRFFVGYIPLLIWMAPFLVYDPCAVSISAFRIIFIIFPLFVLYISSILSGNRSWIIMMVMHTIIIGFKYRKTVLMRPRTSYIIILFVILSVWFVSEIYGEKLEDVTAFLSDSWYIDTRTDQYKQFLSQVSLTDLLIGKGPRATWFWSGREYEWIDGHFTLLAFNGGFILLSTYIIVIIWPAFWLLSKRPSWHYAAPAIILVFWTLAMMGLSTFTSVKASYEHAIISVLAGRSYYLAKSKDREYLLNLNQINVSCYNQNHIYM